MALPLLVFNVSPIQARTQAGSPVEVKIVTCGYCAGAAFFEFMTSEPHPHRHTQCARCQRVHCALTPKACTAGMPQLVVSQAAQG